MLKGKTLHILAVLMMLNLRFAEVIEIKITKDNFMKDKRTWEKMLDNAKKIANGNTDAKKDVTDKKDSEKGEISKKHAKKDAIDKKEAKKLITGKKNTKNDAIKRNQAKMEKIRKIYGQTESKKNGKMNSRKKADASKDKIKEKYVIKDATDKKDDSENLSLELEDIMVIKTENIDQDGNKRLIEKRKKITVKKVRFIYISDQYSNDVSYVRIIKIENGSDKIIYDDIPSVSLPTENEKIEGIDDQAIEYIKSNICFHKNINIDVQKLPEISNLENTKISLELYIQYATKIVAVFTIEYPDRLLIL